MGLMDKAKSLLGKAMRPIHAGDDKLLSHRREIVANPAVGGVPRRIEVHSDAFLDQGLIPVRYSGEGDNISPPLRWSGVPEQARELVLVCEDPDAPMLTPFVHWVVRGIPPQQSSLPEAVDKVPRPADVQGAVQGKNSGQKVGYTGPIPPPGHGPHHYHFELFALDRPLDPNQMPDRESLRKAMAGHVLACGEVVGVYERR
jgi:Raf kinase inhibitor-like YbhB/YbcL family protein